MSRRAAAFGLAIAVVLVACSGGGGVARPETADAAERAHWQDVVEQLRNENNALREQLAASRRIPTTAAEASAQLAESQGRVAALQAQLGSIREQERQETTARWRMRLTVAALLAAVGLGVAAIALPAGRGLRRWLFVAAAGVAATPMLLRMVSDIETHAAWAWPIAGAALALFALPKLREHLHSGAPAGR